MAGHSKWSNIKRKKEINDAKKSKIFTKLVKEITVAARCGGPEPAFNPRLRLAIQNAKGANMPKEAVLRAISKGNEMDAATYHEITYEGYASHGIAIMVMCMTEKLTRTVANIRSIFTKYGGSLEKSGSITFLFHHKGIFTIPLVSITDEEAITFSLIEAGADVLEKHEGAMHISCAVDDFGKIQKQLDKVAIMPSYAGLQYIPNTWVTVCNKALPKLIKLIETLRNDDDVQQVYHNLAMQQEQQAG